jgi:hypothetical protein
VNQEYSWKKDIRTGDATDGGGNQRYILVNLHKSVKILQRYTLVLFEDQRCRLMKGSR